MNKNELNKEQKKVVLSLAIDFLTKNIHYIGGISYTDGVCTELKRALFLKFKIEIQSLYDLKLYIPEFTITNARKLSKTNDFKKIPQTIESGGYWWSREDINSRISFVEALINQIDEK